MFNIKDVNQAVNVAEAFIATATGIDSDYEGKRKDFRIRKEEPGKFFAWVRSTFANNIRLFKNEKAWYEKRFNKQDCCREKDNVVVVDDVHVCYECGFIRG